MDTLPLVNYNVVQGCASGAFAKVYFGQHKQTNAKVAIKKIDKRANNDDGKQVERIKREIDIMRKLKHPLISQLYEVVETEDFIYIVMEFAQNGTLFTRLNDSGAFTEDEASLIFAQILIVMNYLQTDLKIAHRDIKAENILFDQNQNIRIIDFGLSNTSTNPDNLMNTQCGSPAYASPEMILGHQYTFSSDIWSCGVVLYAMVCGFLPFEDPSISRLAQKIVFKEVEYPNNLSATCLDLLKRLLTKNPQSRITLQDAMNHPFVAANIKHVENRIANFQYDYTLIGNVMTAFGFNLEEAQKDMENDVINPGTTILTILKREYMNSKFAPLSCRASFNGMIRKNTVSGAEQLPKLAPVAQEKEKIKLERRKSVHTNICMSPLYNSLKRKLSLTQAVK